MRRFAFLMILVFVAVCAHAQQPESPQAEVGNLDIQFRNGRVTLALSAAPAAAAIDQFFKATGKPYTVKADAGMMMHTFSFKATVRAENVPFEQALEALLEAAGFGHIVENGIYVIMGMEEYLENHKPKMTSGFGGPVASSTREAPPKPIFLRIGPMSVQEAYDAVVKESGVPDTLNWHFRDDLGSTVVPEIRFYGVPPQRAAFIAVAAAGLVPPGPDEYVVAQKGQADFSRLNELNSAVQGMVSWRMASYRAADGQWQYFISNDSPWPVPTLVKQLLTDERNYIVEDRPAGSADSTKGTGVPTVSVNLMNVTLKEALDSILKTTGYTYRIENDVYIVQQIGSRAND